MLLSSLIVNVIIWFLLGRFVCGGHIHRSVRGNKQVNSHANREKCSGGCCGVRTESRIPIWGIPVFSESSPRTHVDLAGERGLLLFNLAIIFSHRQRGKSDSADTLWGTFEWVPFYTPW